MLKSEIKYLSRPHYCLNSLYLFFVGKSHIIFEKSINQEALREGHRSKAVKAILIMLFALVIN